MATIVAKMDENAVQHHFPGGGSGVFILVRRLVRERKILLLGVRDLDAHCHNMGL